MKPLKALIVEDSVNDEELLLRHLAKSGYAVDSIRVQTAADLEKVLAEQDWDIVLSDYGMPGFTGLDALRVLKQSRQPDIPLIIISGTIGENTAVEAMRLGVNDYLLKGSLTRLAPAIERELENSATRRAQKQAEESLRRSEASLAEAQRIAHIGSWDWDIQNDQLYWTKEINRIFGISDFDFGGTFDSFLEIVHPDDRHLVRSAVEATLTQNTSYNIEHRIIRSDGEERIVYEIGEATFDETGKPFRLTGTVQDITERRHVTEALEKAEKRERAMIENALDVICTIDAEGKFVSVSPASLKVWGYLPEELIGESYIDLVVPEDIVKTQEASADIMSGNEARNFENRYIHKNGSLVDIRWTAYWSEKDSLVFCVAHDNTERKAAEAEMRLMKSAIDSIAEGIIITDAQKLDNPIIYTNTAFEKLTGYTLGEIKGQNCHFLQGGETDPRTVKEIREAIKQETTFRGEILNYRKNGEPFWNELAISPVFDPSGRLTNFVGVQQDISERKRLETERTKLLAELHSEKKRLQHIFDNSPSFIVELRGPDFVFEMANPAYYQLVGQRDLIGIPASEALPELMTQGLPEMIGQVYKTGEPFSGNEVPIKLQSAGGSEVVQHYINFVYMPMREADGSISGVISYGIDVTEQVLSRIEVQNSMREQMELAAQLETERARLVAAQSVAKVGSWETDLVTQKVKWSAETFRIYEIDPNQFQPDHQKFLQLGHPDDRAAVHDTFVKSFDRHGVCSFEHRIVLADGRIKLVEDRWEIIRDEQGKPVQANGTCQDITERKQVEVALQESEKRYRYLTNAMPQLVWATDKDGSHFYYNQQWYDFTGLTEEESLGFGFTNALHPDDKGQTDDRWEQSWRNGEGYEIEYRLFSKPVDKYRWFLARAMPVRNESGEITQWVGTCTDIEEQKRAEERVRLADLRALAEYDTLLDRISLLSESLGTARDLQTIYRALYTFAIDSTHCDSIFVSLLDQKSQLRIPSYIRWEDEEFDTSEFPPMPMNDSPHSRAVSTGNTIITDDFQAAIKNQPAIHIGHDKDPSLPQSSLAVPMKIMGRIIGAVEIQSTEKAAFKKEHATALRMAANLTANAIENVRLLEQERIKEEQLRQSQKLESVGLLAGGIAHDFNNMLTAINGYSDLTLRKLDAASPLRGNIKEIKKAGERSAELTHQLLAFSRQQILQPKVFDINETIEETRKMLRRLIREDIELQLHLNPKIAPIKADPGQLTQVIMNLAVNARDAMPTGGVIIIQTDNVHLDDKFIQTHSPMVAGNYVMISVTDTGSGMDEVTRKRIFEPFFTTKTTGEGTGLGLATVYGIVKQSGGYIWVESQIGRGTTFTVYFPPAEASNLPQDLDNTDGIVKTGTETILLVEDEQIVRTLTRQMLEECGYQVIEAASGTEALELYSQADCRIDLLMTDVVMPNMGGRELAENLTVRFPGIKILFTSGYTDDTMVRHGITEAGQNFIQKPFAFEVLAQKIREILDSN